MKKKKIGGLAAVGIIALFVGAVLAVQLSNASGSDQGGLVPLAKLKSYEEAVKEAQAEKEDAMAELRELEERLSEIEKEKSDEDSFVAGLVQDTDKYKTAAGVTDVEGTGVIITIKDPANTESYVEDYSVIAYNYELLLSLVNKLKEAGAEAISINEQRIVNTTEISLAGSSIRINGRATAQPYTIKAIGNPDTLESTLTIRGGVVESMRSKYGLTVDIDKKENVKIARYSGVITFKYAKPIESESTSSGADTSTISGNGAVSAGSGEAS